MVRVARLIALAATASMVAGCVTDGIIGAEVEGQAKPRVIDTAKTRTASKKDAGKRRAAEKKEREQAAQVTAQGDTETHVASFSRQPQTRREEPAAAPADGTLIPARSLFGNWTLGQDGEAKCRLILGGVPIGSAYAARGESNCPQAFSNVQTWEIQGDQIVLRNQSRTIVGRLEATGPFRFDGQSEGGAAVYLIR